MQREIKCNKATEFLFQDKSCVEEKKTFDNFEDIFDSFAWFDAHEGHGGEELLIDKKLELF